MRLWRTKSAQETRELGESLAAELEPDGVLLLTGDLGAGKTVLAQGLAAALGVEPREVQSPSFILVREHQGARCRFVHVDLYRLQPQDVATLGLDEILASPGVKVVEWSERLPFSVPGALSLRFHINGTNGSREIAEVRGESGSKSR